MQPLDAGQLLVHGQHHVAGLRPSHRGQGEELLRTLRGPAQRRHRARQVFVPALAQQQRHASPRQLAAQVVVE